MKHRGMLLRAVGRCGALLAVGLAAQVWAAPATTIVAATQKAISTNPEVEADWHAFQAAEHEQRSARGGYLPSVDLGASAGYERHEIDRLDTETDYKPAGVNLTITQMLYDGFATSSNVARLSRAKRERYFDLLNSVEATTLEAVRAYQDVVRYRELVALAEKNVARHREVLDRIRQKVSAGVGRSVDLEQATGRLALAESNLVIEKSNLHDVSSRYQRVIGEWPASQLAPVDLSKATLPPNIVDALKVAFVEHPALSAAMENIRQSEEQLRNRKSRYHPRLDIRLRGDYGDDIDRIEGQTTDTRAELLLNYNLFNGGSDKAAVAQASKLVMVSKDNREATCREVRQNLRVAYNDYVRIGHQLDYLKVHKDTTDKARTAYLNQFQIGQRTLLDLLDTENEYFQAQRAYVNGSYDYSIATARSLAGMGRIRQAIGITRSDVPSVDAVGGKAAEGSICPAYLPDDAAPVSYAAAPVADRDGDGVIDANDLCPDTPRGTKVDSAGCARKEQVVLKGVNFKFDSTELTEPSKAILDNAARILRENPKTRVEVAGHTDNIGTPEYNIGLSQGRATSVVRYLTSKGVPASQMQAKGYGLTQPKTSNATDEGRATNRRVEFRILD